ncbi:MULTISPECIES: putative bifunctional diguanylate cyclase/phosphodiesterase [Actinokineospora]|uniref:Bifunctional diguanylate cyclase/phosphodiesterase n=1 Tax=Actinokineospora fastidiosa TaxID=1816 RepID=A0A918G7Z2_9PSEU|nr:MULTISPECIES: EAL domain-containing protein [Actinokineospora]UVS82212.1 Bacteriophytochrome cph2 [Actinokineospora sp. UTMC 2448]GGS22867.1 bifunctional diguanylate cyclase/phosphodiesterase [Actinokineospora fastidiosa]
MSDHPGQTTAEPQAEAQNWQAEEAPNRSFLAFSVLVLVSALVTAGLLSWWLPQPENQTVWVGLLLALGFLLAEQLAINVDVRSGVSWSITFCEIPLVIGLFVAPFEVVLAAHLLAGVGTLLIRRVQDRILYNAGAMIFEICAAFAVATWLNDMLSGVAPAWTGVVAGALAAPLSSTALALVCVRILGRRMRVGAAARLFLRTTVLGLVNASVGVVGYQVAVHAEWGWPLLVLALAGLSALYIAYSGLLREQRDLEALSEVSLMVARSGHQAAARPSLGVADPTEGADVTDADEWQVIADRVKDQLGAARVVLRLRFEPQAPMHVIVSGDDLPADTVDLDATGPRADALLRLPGSHVRHFRRVDSVPEIRQGLLRRGVDEALVAPLRSANHLLGVVEAHDKLSRWRGFGQADVRMIGTMASHLATALDNRRLLATLRHDAYHDPLTGLLNRPGFRRTAGDLLRRKPDSVVLRIDLDVLPAVSDALGYAWSDRMIVAAGRRLRDALGPEVPLARLEGGAFAILLADCDLAGDAERLQESAERLRRDLTAPYPVDRLTVEAGSVVGYASPHTADAEGAELDIEALLQRADVALRAARSSGEAVREYLPTMGQIFLRRFQLVTQFRQALETGQVKVHYQPKVALPSRQVLGVEALVRWRHPEFGKLDPDEFVPAVEAAGLVDALTGFVMDQALCRVRKWLDRGLRISAAVNLSVRSLDDATFPDRVADALARHDVPPELLTLELTESGVMADPQRALPVLRALHALGVVLAVDDFGTGYSSLAYLRQLPVDEVKIDKSFVLGMGTDLGDHAVVRSIVELGHSLGLTVVAEGVEDDLARDQLTAMGCDVAQGYLISRPLSESRLEAWLQARTTQAKGMRDEMVLTLLT